MKRLTHFALPITVLLLLFLFPPVMGVSSHAQVGDSIASPSDADPETEDDTATGIEDEFEELLQSDHRSASPSDALIATPADAAPIEITEIEYSKHLANRILLLMQGDSSASLDLPKLNGSIYFYQEGAPFAEKDVRYSVSYETEDFDDTYRDQTGLFFLNVSIILEDERYIMAPEVSTDILIPIFLYNPEQPSFLPPPDPDLNTYDAMETFHVVVDIYTDLQQIKAMLIKDFPYQRFYVFFENGYYLNVPNTWDLDALETGVPGIYQAYRRPELPQGVLLEEVPEAVCSINIQDSETFTLSSPISFGNNIVITWLYPTPEPSLFRLWYRIGEGDWLVDTNEYFMHLHKDGNNRLFLNPWNMKKDIHYQFQLEYDGVHSDILKLCVNQDGFYIPNEGDEDGGDRDNQTPPDVIQPPPDTSESGGSSGSGHSQSSSPGSHTSSAAGESSGSPEGYGPGYQTQPVPESTASVDDNAAEASGQAAGHGIPSSPKSSVTAEADTSTTAIWSGRRIHQYLKASPGLPLIFEKDLVRVEIPAGSPVLSSLSDSDFLQVEIQALSADTLYLAVSLNGTPLTGLLLTVTMPWAGDDQPEDLQVRAVDREWSGKVDQFHTDGSITFTVTQSGVYSILPSSPEEAAESIESVTAKEKLTVTHPAIEPELSSIPAGRNSLPVMAFPVFLILCGIGVIVFLYYKRKKG